MALPEIVLPAGLPYFLAEGHAITMEPVYGDLARDRALTRRRRLVTRAKRLQTVSMILEADEMQAFHDWFENDLKAGALAFSARIMDEGGRTFFWEAEWVAPYSSSAMARGRWRVSGQLRLGFSTPTVDGPARGSFAASVLVPLTSVASGEVTKHFLAELLVPLLAEGKDMPPRPLEAEVVVGLDAYGRETVMRKFEAEVNVPLLAQGS